MFGIDERVARYTWTIIAMLMVLAILDKIYDTVFAFIVAVLFAYLLSPIVEYLNRRLPGRSRVPALAIVYVVLVGLVIWGLFEVVTRALAEASVLAAKLPGLLSKFEQSRGLRAGSASLRSAILAELSKQLAEHSNALASIAPKAALKAVSLARDLAFLILVPILSFFFLKDGAEMRDFILNMAPEGARRRQLEEIGTDLHVLLVQYMRALIILAGIAFGAFASFFSLIKVPYAILLAAIEFPLEIIPVVGPFIGFVMVTLVAIFSGYHHVWWVVIFMGVFRMVQDYGISPRLMSAEMELHPLVVIFGVLAGAQLAGVIGSFLSVPVLSGLRIVYFRLRRRRVIVVRKSSVTPSP
jgi:predicted PurR-regulated permease PerM